MKERSEKEKIKDEGKIMKEKLERKISCQQTKE